VTHSRVALSPRNPTPPAHHSHTKTETRSVVYTNVVSLRTKRQTFQKKHELSPPPPPAACNGTPGRADVSVKTGLNFLNSDIEKAPTLVTAARAGPSLEAHFRRKSYS